VYEGFNYTAGSSLIDLNGGTGFVEAWQTNSTPNNPAVGLGATIVAGSLNYTDTVGNKLVTSGGKLDVNGAFGTAQPTRYMSVTNGTDGTTVWMSYVGVRQGQTTNSSAVPLNPYPRAANVAFYSNTTEMITIGNSTSATNNTWALIPRGSLTNIKPTTDSYSVPSLVVVRIDYKASGLDDAYIWVNPTLGVEPLIANADANSLGAFSFDFNRMRPFAGNPASTGPSGDMLVDEFRVGTAFLDVTPFVAIPEPSVTALLLTGLALLGVEWKRRRSS
jgi:hypothetical protein